METALTRLGDLKAEDVFAYRGDRYVVVSAPSDGPPNQNPPTVMLHIESAAGVRKKFVGPRTERVRVLREVKR